MAHVHGVEQYLEKTLDGYLIEDWHQISLLLVLIKFSTMLLITVALIVQPTDF